MPRHRLDDRLRQIATRGRLGGVEASLTEARLSGLAVRDGRVRVIVTGAGASSAITLAGGTIEATSAGLIQALVEPADLPALAASAGVEDVRPPASFSNAAVTGEGLATTGAAQFAGIGTGAGTTVAVIDLSFAGVAAAQAQGELPADAVTFDHCGRLLERRRARDGGGRDRPRRRTRGPAAPDLRELRGDAVTGRRRRDRAGRGDRQPLRAVVQHRQRRRHRRRRVTRRECRKSQSSRDRLGQRSGERRPNALGRLVRRHERERPARVRPRRRRQRDDGPSRRPAVRSDSSGTSGRRRPPTTTSTSSGPRTAQSLRRRRTLSGRLRLPPAEMTVLDEHRCHRRVRRRRDHARLRHGLPTPRSLHRRATAVSRRRPEHRRAGVVAGGGRGRRGMLERYRRSSPTVPSARRSTDARSRTSIGP